MACRSLSRRPVMKNTATPLAFAALNRSSAGIITGATACRIQALNPHGPVGSRSQAPSRMNPKLLALIFAQFDSDVSSISRTSAGLLTSPPRRST